MSLERASKELQELQRAPFNDFFKTCRCCKSHSLLGSSACTELLNSSVKDFLGSVLLEVVVNVVQEIRNLNFQAVDKAFSSF